MAESNVCSSRLGRALFIAAGSVCLVVGALGIVVPLLPTTPFLILAALSYARGSVRCHRWLVTNRVFGRYLADYLCGRGVPWRVRVSALVFLWAAIVLTVVFIVEAVWLRLLLAAVAVGVSVHVVLIKGRGEGHKEA